jgi:hypothetical protein
VDGGDANPRLSEVQRHACHPDGCQVWRSHGSTVAVRGMWRMIAPPAPSSGGLGYYAPWRLAPTLRFKPWQTLYRHLGEAGKGALPQWPYVPRIEG